MWIEKLQVFGVFVVKRKHIHVNVLNKVSRAIKVKLLMNFCKSIINKVMPLWPTLVVDSIVQNSSFAMQVSENVDGVRAMNVH